MRTTIRYYIRPRKVDWPAKITEAGQFFQARGFGGCTFLHLQIQLDRFSDITTSRPEEVIPLLKRHQTILELLYEIHAVKPEEADSGNFIKLRISWDSGSTAIQIDSHNEDLASALHTYLQKLFSLRNPEPKREERTSKNLQATVFLGRHFDDYSEPLGKKLRHFLELRGFDVKEADAFRSQPIPEKVKDLIEQQDIYLGLVTGARSHEWIVAEGAYAHAQNKHVIFVVEEGSGFNPTLHGKDQERINIPPGRVEVSFIPLLQEFNGVRVLGL